MVSHVGRGAGVPDGAGGIDGGGIGEGAGRSMRSPSGLLGFADGRLPFRPRCGDFEGGGKARAGPRSGQGQDADGAIDGPKHKPAMMRGRQEAAAVTGSELWVAHGKLSHRPAYFPDCNMTNPLTDARLARNASNSL